MKEHTLTTLRFFLQHIVPISAVATASAAEIAIDNASLTGEKGLANIRNEAPQAKLFAPLVEALVMF
jgi:hypothetical protein